MNKVDLIQALKNSKNLSRLEAEKNRDPVFRSSGRGTGKRGAS